MQFSAFALFAVLSAVVSGAAVDMNNLEARQTAEDTKVTSSRCITAQKPNGECQGFNAKGGLIRRSQCFAAKPCKVNGNGCIFKENNTHLAATPSANCS